MSNGGSPASSTSNPALQQALKQQFEPHSLAEEKGMKIGPLLGLFIPGFGEEEGAIEGIEAVEGAGGLEKLLNSVRQHGRTVTFASAGSEELRYLDYMGAEANCGGPGCLNILLRPNPTKEAVLEEFLHGTQDRLGIIDRLGQQGAETHVKDFMGRHRRLLGLP